MIFRIAITGAFTTRIDNLGNTDASANRHDSQCPESAAETLPSLPSGLSPMLAPARRPHSSKADPCDMQLKGYFHALENRSPTSASRFHSVHSLFPSGK